jgi:hypothetical protein
LSCVKVVVPDQAKSKTHNARHIGVTIGPVLNLPPIIRILSAPNSLVTSYQKPNLILEPDELLVLSVNSNNSTEKAERQ